MKESIKFWGAIALVLSFLFGGATWIANAQVVPVKVEIGTEVKRLDGRIDRVEENIKEIRTDIKGIKKDIGNMKIDIVIMKSDITSMKSDIKTILSRLPAPKAKQ